MYIGHTRFSLFDPESSGWRASNGSRFESLEEYQDYLFSDERLDPRCDIFVNHSLPQLALAAEGYDVTHVVSYSSALPEKHQEILRDAAAKYPFLVLDLQVGGEPSATPLGLARAAHRGPDATRPAQAPFGLYRLDDDDLLPADYFSQISAYVTPEHAGMMVTLGAGATALYLDGAYYNIRECYAPMIAIGLMSICMFAEDGTLVKPASAAHNESDRSNAVIFDSRKTGFLWTRHVAQDTSLGWGLPDDVKMADIIRQYMDQYPEALPGKFSEAFPSIADKMHYQSGPDRGTLQSFEGARTLTEEPAVFTLEPLTGRIDLALDVECSAGTEVNNALISFDLVDGEGDSLSLAADTIELPSTGLKLSPTPDIGYFTYVTTDEHGPLRQRITLTLPDGITLRSFSIRRYRRPASTITIANVSIQEVHSSNVAVTTP